MDISLSKAKSKHLLLLFAFCYSAVCFFCGLQGQLTEKFYRQIKGGSHAKLHIQALSRSSAGNEPEEQEQPLQAGSLYSGFIIYRVPETIRRINQDAYTPHVVSIGPYHRGDLRLQNMDEYKRRYLRRFLGKSQPSKEEFLSYLEEHELYLRNRYSEPIQMNTTELAEMVLEDAAFIFELLYRYIFGPSPFSQGRFPRFPRPYNESFPTTPYVVSLIKNDMLMFENQLPFPLLEELLDLANITAPDDKQDPISAEKNEEPPTLIIKKNEKLSLLKLIYIFYSNRPAFRVQFNKLENLKFTYYHFLDFLRQVHLPPHENRENKSRAPSELDFSQIPSVTELQQGGVEFRLAESRNLFNVTFNRKEGVLEIPHFYLTEVTEILFRNLIIYEQFCFPQHQHVADYMRFLSVLVKEPKDVEVLVQSGAFDNGLDDVNAATILIHSVLRGTYSRTPGFYFSDVFKELVSYYHNPRHSFVAKLKQDYFNTPWAAIAAVAAAVALICAILQTVFTIIKRK